MTNQEQRVMELAARILDVFTDEYTVIEKLTALGVAGVTIRLGEEDEEPAGCPTCAAAYPVCH